MTAFSNNNNNTRKATTATKAKKDGRKRRPRRELPEDLTNFYIADGERPSALDVIAGRGGGSNHHEGNKRYWRRVLAERPGYKQLGKNDNAEKNEIAQAIYDYILATGGRFLMLERSTQKWFNLPQKIGLDKIKQALRDKYVPHFLEGEELTHTMAAAPLVPTPALSQFKAFLEEKNQRQVRAPSPAVPQTGLFSTLSLDFGSIFGQNSSLDKLDMFKSGDFLNNLLSKPSLDLLSRPSLDAPSPLSLAPPTTTLHETKSSTFDFEGLMRGDLIATCDNMAQAAKLVTAPRAPSSLEAMLNQQMEAAIPTSRTLTAV